MDKKKFSKNSNGVSNTYMTDNNCILCKIVSGKLPTSSVYEDDLVLAILDINPVHKGHTLIIPKEHHPSYEETPDKIITHLFSKGKDIMGAIKKAVGADFVVLSIVGIDIPHFHIHLMPRFKGDGLHGWPTVKYDSDKEKEEVAQKIRKELM
jgi:histidine triad (HIT) family protein